MDNLDKVIHFAGLKAVGESKSKPLSYYRVNHGGTVNVLEVGTRQTGVGMTFKNLSKVKSHDFFYKSKVVTFKET